MYFWIYLMICNNNFKCLRKKLHYLMCPRFTIFIKSSIQRQTKISYHKQNNHLFPPSASTDGKFLMLRHSILPFILAIDSAHQHFHCVVLDGDCRIPSQFLDICILYQRRNSSLVWQGRHKEYSNLWHVVLCWITFGRCYAPS